MTITFETILMDEGDVRKSYGEKHKYMAFIRGTWKELNVEAKPCWEKSIVTIKNGDGAYLSVDAKNALRGIEGIEIRCMQ